MITSRARAAGSVAPVIAIVPRLLTVAPLATVWLPCPNVTVEPAATFTVPAQLPLLAPPVFCSSSVPPKFAVPEVLKLPPLPSWKLIVPLAPFCPSTVSVDAAAIGAAVVVFQNRLLPTPEALMK